MFVYQVTLHTYRRGGATYISRLRFLSRDWSLLLERSRDRERPLLRDRSRWPVGAASAALTASEPYRGTLACLGEELGLDTGLVRPGLG